MDGIASVWYALKAVTLAVGEIGEADSKEKVNATRRRTQSDNTVQTLRHRGFVTRHPLAAQARSAEPSQSAPKGANIPELKTISTIKGLMVWDEWDDAVHRSVTT